MINTIITDFDGTLVDTFKANFLAYEKAFSAVGMRLDEAVYRRYFGLRADSFMKILGIEDKELIKSICDYKVKFYPEFFSQMKPNNTLIDIIATFHNAGVKTAIASTARKENLMRALDNFNLAGIFDLVYAGFDVKKGKPDPEIYIRTMAALQVSPEETLVFEDSEVGVQAAKAAGCRCVRVTSEWFE